MVSGLLTPLLWAFVPSYLTKQALPLLTSHLPALFPPSQLGSPVFVRNYRICFTLIVGGYLIWSFASSGGTGGGRDWYALLGVRKDAEDEHLKKAFRTLSRTYHPDRSNGQSEGHFILIRQAYEVLSDPVKRYAYDRFGPDTVNWKTCKTVKDYMYAGMMRSVGFYVFSGGAMVLLTMIGRAREGSYWTKTLFAVLLLLELHLVLAPTPSHPTSGWILGRPQFAQVELAHRLWASLSVAINQLAGVWGPQRVSDEVAWQHVGRLVKELEADSIGQFQGDIVPILAKSGQPHLVQAALQQGMEQILVDRTISSHPLVRDQWREGLTAASHPIGLQVPPGISDLELACRVPLPPSPRLYPRR